MLLSVLRREFGVSQPTGYRWINRYMEAALEGLLDLSRKPHGCSQATSEVTKNAILSSEIKTRTQKLGSRKARLEVLQPAVIWPAASTFGNILSRAGLTNPNRRNEAPRRTPNGPLRSRHRTSSGVWTLRATSVRVTVHAATRSRLPMHTAAMSSAARVSDAWTSTRSQRSANLPRVSTGCQQESAPTKALRWPEAGSSGCPSC